MEPTCTEKKFEEFGATALLYAFANCTIFQSLAISNSFSASDKKI